MDRDYGRLPSILLHGPDVIELGRNCGEELLESPCLNDPYEGGCCQRVTLTKVTRLDLAPVIGLYKDLIEPVSRAESYEKFGPNMKWGWQAAW